MALSVANPQFMSSQFKKKLQNDKQSKTNASSG